MGRSRRSSRMAEPAVRGGGRGHGTAAAAAAPTTTSSTSAACGSSSSSDPGGELDSDLNHADLNGHLNDADFNGHLNDGDLNGDLDGADGSPAADPAIRVGRGNNKYHDVDDDDRLPPRRAGVGTSRVSALRQALLAQAGPHALRASVWRGREEEPLLDPR